MAPPGFPAKGMAHIASRHSAAETLQRLKALVEARGLTVFAVIDHSGAAAGVGLHMPPANVLIFGSPKAGTPVMMAAPTLAIDLPLKALVWQAADGSVWLSYNTPEYLRERHDFPAEFLPNLAAAIPLFEKAAGEA